MYLASVDSRYYVVAHADKNGPKDRVFSLSEQRAISIVDYLQAKGIGKDRLKPIGAGWKCFIGSESNPDDQRRNRRIEFIRINR